jgi:hypothetical protein
MSTGVVDRAFTKFAPEASEQGVINTEIKKLKDQTTKKIGILQSDS